MTREIVRKFIEKFVSGKELNDDTNIFESGLVNSLFAMQLVAFVEKEFDVVVENDDINLNNFEDINSIVNLVESKLG